MTTKKKPVDRTPICDPAYLRRIDPMWMPGRVPLRFWQDETHRRDYLLWSAHRLGFRSMEDFYRLELGACYRRNYGRGLAAFWGNSALAAVRECFPEYDWKPWLFVAVPNGFWESLGNRQSYLDWLGQHLGYRRMNDWYEITIHDFLGNRGAGLMAYYRSSPALAVTSLVTGRNWCEWKFQQVPLAAIYIVATGFLFGAMSGALHADNAHVTACSFQQYGIAERQAVDIGRVEGNQHGIEVEFLHSGEQDCRIVVTSKSQIPDTALVSGLQECFHGSALAEDPGKIIFAAKVVKLPQIQVISL